MPITSLWLFDFPICRTYDKSNGPLIVIDECELNIIWKLAQKGPLNIYQLGNSETYFLPEVWSGIVKVEGSRYGTGEKCSYAYSFIYRKVKGLARKSLVEVSISKQKEARIVRLTLLGLYVYMLGSTDKDKFKNVTNPHHHHSYLLPFSSMWDLLMEKLGESRVKDALECAMKGFGNLAIVRYKLRSLGLEFEGLLQNDLISAVRIDETKREMDNVVLELLRREESSVLRKSYIAYLAVQDIWKLRNKDRKEVQELSMNLASEKDLASLEKREVGFNSLFEGDRLKEFLPEYATEGFYLTGMFVENLLWQKRSIEAKHEMHDFEVEF